MSRGDLASSNIALSKKIYFMMNFVEMKIKFWAAQSVVEIIQLAWTNVTNHLFAKKQKVNTILFILFSRYHRRLSVLVLNRSYKNLVSLSQEKVQVGESRHWVSRIWTFDRLIMCTLTTVGATLLIFYQSNANFVTYGWIILGLPKFGYFVANVNEDSFSH